MLIVKNSHSHRFFKNRLCKFRHNLRATESCNFVWHGSCCGITVCCGFRVSKQIFFYKFLINWCHRVLEKLSDFSLVIWSQLMPPSPHVAAVCQSAFWRKPAFSRKDKLCCSGVFLVARLFSIFEVAFFEKVTCCLYELMLVPLRGCQS